VLLTSNDVTYAHLRIVDDYSKVVGRGAIRLAYYEVLDVGEADLTPQSVTKAPTPYRRPEVKRSPACLVLRLVDQPCSRETPRGLFVKAPAFALPVRPLVEREAEPVQVFELSMLELLRTTRLVGVFDAEDKLTAVMPGEEIVKERRARPTEVEHPRRTRGEADPDRATVQTSTGPPGGRWPERLYPHPVR
jgi:hypothetical protein